MKQAIGNSLLRRLQEVGVQHIFGVPGDCNLEFMQQLEDRGCPTWIGTCNELNGSYAADVTVTPGCQAWPLWWLQTVWVP
jgi:indolepyruvate decarboxylase